MASLIAAGDIGLSLSSIFISFQLPQKPANRIVVVVNHALLQGDDGIVSDVNAFRADLGAALRDVAVADAELVLQQRRARDVVEWMHFETGDAHEESRTAKLLLLAVIAQDVTNVLTKKTLD